MTEEIVSHYRLILTFTEPVLGHRKDHQRASHSYFHRSGDGKNPIILSYHVMGFLKEASRALNEVFGDELESTLTEKVFVKPKEIPLVAPEGSDGAYILSRPPQRMETEDNKAEMVEVTSEAMPVGTSVECELLVYPGVDPDILIALLEYGALKGIGLGRNQGFGRFRFSLEEMDGAGT